MVTPIVVDGRVLEYASFGKPDEYNDLGSRRICYALLKIKNEGSAEAKHVSCFFLPLESRPQFQDKVLPVELKLVYVPMTVLQGLKVGVGYSHGYAIGIFGNIQLVETERDIPVGEEAFVLAAFIIKDYPRLFFGVQGVASHLWTKGEQVEGKVRIGRESKVRRLVVIPQGWDGEGSIEAPLRVGLLD